jgi:hypothetical protein
LTGPIHGAHRRPQIAVRPPVEQGTDGRLTLETIASVEEAHRRAPRPRLGEREVVGDGIDRKET